VGRLVIRHVDDVEWQEVRAQLHGDRRVSIWNRFLEWTPERLVIHTRYDPGLVVEAHAHVSDQIIFVLEGDLTVGERECPAGTVILLDRDTVFGPLIAGDQGAYLLEVGLGDPMPVPADPDGFARLLADRDIELLPPPPFVPPST
jgi:hypothetical protein